MFREGTDAGKAAVQLQPNKPDGHFWLGANYGGSAAHSTLSNLSSFQDIKGEMEAVLKLDEGYQGYSAYLGLGRLYLQAPRVLGGDQAKAIEYLEKGVKLNPNNTMMRLHLAEAYDEVNRDADAKKQIETIMADHSRSEVRSRAQRRGREGGQTPTETRATLKARLTLKPNAEGVSQLQPRVGTTLGRRERGIATLKEFASGSQRFQRSVRKDWWYPGLKQPFYEAGSCQEEFGF